MLTFIVFILLTTMDFMTLIIILLAVFVGIAFMVILGERFGKPMNNEAQTKMAKTTKILVFVLIIAAIINGLA